ncbi:MAG: hypothetical protein ABJB47_08665 [Actinomycetota bacterium]
MRSISRVTLAAFRLLVGRRRRIFPYLADQRPECLRDGLVAVPRGGMVRLQDHLGPF